MKNITKKYTNGEVTIVWQPALCVHSAKCFLGLPSVFDPTKRPWINPQGADTQKIVNQVKRCPFGALSYYLNKEENNPQKP
ncbi:MAG: (4Fe-4S)-binding protein [candidate division Zixibacteria bacterium]|nr:(4Fe-4S)-binding protein [candidate division Zixibacteria bacterium]